MTSNNIRKKFLDFFQAKGHKVLPSASLIPRDDSSVLFTTAGMQQFRKFYANPEEAPAASVATIQKCLRTSDIEEVGNSTHLTFFEMLGNFSFGYPEKEGSYFKKEAIVFAWEFLTDILKIEKNRIRATYFKDDTSEIKEDKESRDILQNIEGLKEIKPQGFDDNFWSLGTENSPGGPTVEFYVDNVEIWNLVFNQYIYQGKKYIPSKYRGVDTGMGLERLVAVMQEKDDIYETDLFWPIICEIEKLSGKSYQDNQKAFRVIADHMKAACFILDEGIVPSNKDQGYIARRLIRRSIVEANSISISDNFTVDLLKIVGDIYQIKFDFTELKNEETKFRKTLSSALTELKSRELTGAELFNLYQSYGLPIEIAIEEANKINKAIPKNAIDEFKQALKEHQEKSRTASAGMFKGGLADAGEETTKLHTAAHLMLAALRQVLGDQVEQKGSNITAERLRFDFNNPEKLSEEQIKRIEEIVNKNIEVDLPVTVEEMSIEEAKSSGATGSFSDRYGEKVKVYTIGDPSSNLGQVISREICGGPHINHTGELGHFKIVKEESSSAGVRRIKAILE